jgi:hypothetical protein
MTSRKGKGVSSLTSLIEKKRQEVRETAAEVLAASSSNMPDMAVNDSPKLKKAVGRPRKSDANSNAYKCLKKQYNTGHIIQLHHQRAAELIYRAVRVGETKDLNLDILLRGEKFTWRTFASSANRLKELGYIEMLPPKTGDIRIKVLKPFANRPNNTHVELYTKLKEISNDGREEISFDLNGIRTLAIEMDMMPNNIIRRLKEMNTRQYIDARFAEDLNDPEAAYIVKIAFTPNEPPALPSK